MREASHDEHKGNGADYTYPLSWSFQISCLNVGAHLYGINNGVFETLICVSYKSVSLMGPTAKKVICRLPQRCRLNMLCASLGYSCQFGCNGPGCICPQNMNATCSMPLLQIQTVFVSQVAEGKQCLNAVPSR